MDYTRSRRRAAEAPDVSQKEKALSGYTFRIKLPKAGSASLQIEEPEWTWQLGNGLPVLRLATGSDIPISQADTLYFFSHGWPDEEAAIAASARYVGALARSLARLRVGVDYGDRAASGGGFTEAMIDKIRNEHGLRVINERPGIMVYETEPSPVFAGSTGSIGLAVQAFQFERVFEAALKVPKPLSVHERVSIVLYNAAFFEESQDARFLLHMMALEALIQPQDRSPEAMRHVDRLVDQTRRSAQLVQADKDSLCGALERLRQQSIGQAGRALVRQLEGLSYGGLDAVAFFNACYALRSRLVHGDNPLPSRAEVSSAAANLELMVSDLLSGDLRDISMVAPSG